MRLIAEIQQARHHPRPSVWKKMGIDLGKGDTAWVMTVLTETINRPLLTLVIPVLIIVLVGKHITGVVEDNVENDSNVMLVSCSDKLF